MLKKCEIHLGVLVDVFTHSNLRSDIVNISFEKRAKICYFFLWTALHAPDILCSVVQLRIPERVVVLWKDFNNLGFFNELQ